MVASNVLSKVNEINSLYNGDYVKLSAWTGWSNGVKVVTKLDIITTRDWYTGKQAKEFAKKLKMCYRFVNKFNRRNRV